MNDCKGQGFKEMPAEGLHGAGRQPDRAEADRTGPASPNGDRARPSSSSLAT